MKWFENLFLGGLIVFNVFISDGATINDSTTISDSRTSFELTLKPMWHELDNNQDTITQFGSKWILVGTIDLKKRSPKEIHLDQLVLHWRGMNIDNLLGSLYKKEIDKPLLALEENLICDSYWNQSTQKLILKFDQPLHLETHTSLCLVLTIPPTLEPTIKHGSFVLENNCLPYQLRKSLANQPFTLAFN